MMWDCTKRIVAFAQSFDKTAGKIQSEKMDFQQVVENGHMVFFHRNQSGIVLNKEPRFRTDGVIIPFVKHAIELYYLEEYIPGEESAVAIVAQRLKKLSYAELLHIQLCHICPTLIIYLFRVATDVPQLKELNDFKCHCCVEPKMKHAQKPPRSIKTITMPVKFVSLDATGPLRIRFLHGNRAFFLASSGSGVSHLNPSIQIETSSDKGHLW